MVLLESFQVKQIRNHHRAAAVAIAVVTTAPPFRPMVRLTDDPHSTQIRHATDQIRLRNIPLAEKFIPGETVEQAAMRGIKEELGSFFEEETSHVEVFSSTKKVVYEEKSSQSYPRLLTRYRFDEIHAVVKGLPPTNFKTLEYSKGRLKQTHQWEWQSLEVVRAMIQSALAQSQRWVQEVEVSWTEHAYWIWRSAFHHD